MTDQGHNLFFMLPVPKGISKLLCSCIPSSILLVLEPNIHLITQIFTTTNIGHFDMVKFLICNLKCDPNVLNDNGNSLIHQACYKVIPILPNT